MRIEEIRIKKIKVWLVIDQLRAYNKNNEIEVSENVLCYFKLTEPTPFIYGELFKDEDGKPKLFQNADTAIDFAMKELEKR